MISENSLKILEFLKQNNDKNMTAQDIADALGMPKKTVDGAFTSAIQRKDKGFRVEKEVEMPDGLHKIVKFLHLNDDGMNYDPVAEEAAKAAAKAAEAAEKAAAKANA